MKLWIGFLLSLSMVGCAAGLNIQKKCNQIAEHKTDGTSVLTSNYVCE